MSPGTSLVVVSGVTATGKSTIGRELARRLGVEYADADDFHPPDNIAKMRAGQPLTEADREPWLDSIGEWLRLHAAAGAVASCSALRRTHRERLLAEAPDAVFLQLSADEAVLRERIRRREDHFMPESLLRSQLESFEPLSADELGVTVDAEISPIDAIDTFRAWWRTAGPEG